MEKLKISSAHPLFLNNRSKAHLCVVIWCVLLMFSSGERKGCGEFGISRSNNEECIDSCLDWFICVLCATVGGFVYGQLVYESICWCVWFDVALQAAAYWMFYYVFGIIVQISVVHSSRQASTYVYSFGFDRLYPLLWFANAILLIFQGLFLSEGIAEGVLLGSELEAKYVSTLVCD